MGSIPAWGAVGSGGQVLPRVHSAQVGYQWARLTCVCVCPVVNGEESLNVCVCVYVCLCVCAE